MSRISRAARTLTAEVTALRPDAEVEASGDPDGFGVVRTLKFDEVTSEWLEPLLAELADPRVLEAHVTDAGYLHVALTASLANGESTAPFNLAAAQDVVEDQIAEPEKPKAPVKKAAAKKAAAKKSAG